MFAGTLRVSVITVLTLAATMGVAAPRPSPGPAATVTPTRPTRVPSQAASEDRSARDRVGVAVGANSSGNKPKRGRRASPPARGQIADSTRLPREHAPSIVQQSPRRTSSLLGYAGSLARSRFRDERRRLPATARPHAFGSTLLPGEQFKFDVSFAGNPVGLAEASVVGIENDPRGGPPRGAPVLKLEGHARTSGILSLLSVVTDDASSTIDAVTGAPIESVNVIHYSGWTNKKYRRRVTRIAHEGRGQVRIVDTKDKKAKRMVERLPLDTFDPLSSMAWVRSLRLEPGETAKAHAIDGTILLRVEIVGRPRSVPDPLPTIVKALEIPADGIDTIEGTVTRVDRYDRAVPGKRVYTLRAWISADDRRIPLVLESDMWVGSIRLVLSHYQPPR